MPIPQKRSIKVRCKLPEEFYQRDVHIVARELLGKFFVKRIGKKNLVGKIVEVEAYDGSIDEASHSFRGKTKRNEVMFQGGGLLYVYFTYGMHFCANIVTGKVNDGKAILLRAFEPVEGIEEMAMNRYGKFSLSHTEMINLTNGPGKICRAFKIGKEENSTGLLGSAIFILDSPKLSKIKIVTSTRIGIKKSVDLLWRYYIKNNPFVSKK